MEQLRRQEEDRAENLSQQAEQALRNDSTYKDKWRNVSNRLQELSYKILELEKSMEKHQKYMDFSSKTTKIEYTKPYSIHQGRVHLSENGKLAVELRETEGPMVASFAHSARFNLSSSFLQGANPMDVQNKRNFTPMLPQDQTITRELHEKIFQGIYCKLLVFIYKQPCPYMKRESNKKGWMIWRN